MIKNKDLRNLFGINSDKAMRKVIQNIRENKDFIRPICSIAGKKGGFYIGKTTDDTAYTKLHIKLRANRMLRLLYVLEWKEQMAIKEGFIKEI